MINLNLNLLATMTSSSLRQQTALSIAERFGAKNLVIFDYDDEVARFLPSLGFTQSIRGGKEWQEFLNFCSTKGSGKAMLPFPPSNEIVPVVASVFKDLIWVFQANDLHTEGLLDDWRHFDCSLAKILKSERSVLKQESQNQILLEMTDDLRSYANALNAAKLNLNKALQETDVARTLAENANATKSAFLANMSHEIRTPLSAILGFNALLKDPALVDEDRRNFIDTIERNGKALTRIIDDILDLAKVEAGKLEIEFGEFSLSQLLNETVDLFRDIAAQKKIGISLAYMPVPQMILSDSARLRQVFINIIGNAVKFTNKDDVKITVRGVADETAANSYNFVVEVKDSGPGLSLEQRQRLFQPFMQGDNSVTRKFGGTGLGLALSKRLIEALSGTIEIRDHTVGEGCTFVINFPAKCSNQDSGLTETISKSVPLSLVKKRLDNVKILLVDDSVDNLLLAKRLLVRSGATVETAGDGQEAIEKVLATDYDIVLMDIQMPRMDGYEAMRKLRSNGCRLPIIALTAHAMLEEKQKSMEAGFDGHLTKPLDFDEMIKMISRHTLR